MGQPTDLTLCDFYFNMGLLVFVIALNAWDRLGTASLLLLHLVGGGGGETIYRCGFIFMGGILNNELDRS